MFRHTPRHLTFEQLSARETMAGDVSVAVVNNELLVTGDNLPNALQVDFLAVDQVIRIQGVPTPNLLGQMIPTKVNGQSSVEIPLANYNKDIHWIMNGGNDQVKVNGHFASSGEKMARDLIFEMGTGDDELGLASVSITDDLLIDTGAGQDWVDQFIVEVGFAREDRGNNNITINTGAGADIVSMLAVANSGNINIDTGIGTTKTVTTTGIVNSSSDQVELTGVVAEKFLTIKTNDGSDQVALISSGGILGVSLDLGEGSDELSIDMSASENKKITNGNLAINLGSGVDTLSIANDVIVGGTTTVLDA